MHLADHPTPALVIDTDRFDANVRAMVQARPGDALRPHAKAHKCTELAAHLTSAGHHRHCGATIAECVGLARAGLGKDLLLANETLDTHRLAELVATGARVTVAVDSEPTIDAAARAGIDEVVIDVNVGLPRCGCRPADAGRLAEAAAARGLSVRGVMGYEGHLVGIKHRDSRSEGLAPCRTALDQARELVLDAVPDARLVSVGGTGTYDLHPTSYEVQAGSYTLMDTAYDRLGLPFRPALFVMATVISTNTEGYAVADAGLKSLGMDHGNPDLLAPGSPADADGGRLDVWFCSDEHTTFATDPASPVRVGDRVFLIPAHVDPTVAYHSRYLLVAGPADPGSTVIDTWNIDLRGW